VLPMTESGSRTPTSAASPRKPLLQPDRLRKMAIFVLVAAAPPLIAVGLIFGFPAAEAAVFGVLIAFLNMIMGGTRLALAAAVGVILFTPVSLACGTTPLAGAAIMAVVCLAVGTSAGWGLQRGLTMVPLAIAYLLISPPSIDGHAPEPSSTAYLLSVTAVMGISTLLPLAALSFLMRDRVAPRPTGNSRADSIEYAVIISALTAIATGAVLALRPGPNSFWLVLTLLAIVQVGPQATLRKTVSRSGGTLLGAAVAVVLVILIPNSTAILVFGLIALLLTLTFAGGSSYWLYTACLTPTIIMLSGASAAESVAEARVIYTLIGAGLALVAFSIALVVRRFGAHQPASSPMPST
jgi:hypothetical protein